MNYHSDEWIMAGVQRHYDEVTRLYRPEQIIGVIYTGSANYNADCENSDIDTWALIIEDEYDPRNYTVNMHQLDSEVIWKCDIRSFISGILHSDFWYILPLFSKYRILNPMYATLYELIYARREEYAYNNVPGALAVLMEQINKRANYLNPELQFPSYEKTLYYLVLSYIGINIYKYGAPMSSLFYNDIYGAELKRIKDGTVNYLLGKQIYYAILNELRALQKQKFKSSINSELIEFSQKQIDKILEEYNKH